MIESYLSAMPIKALKAAGLTFNLCRFLAPAMFMAMAIYVYTSNRELPILIPIIQSLMGMFGGFVFHVMYKKVQIELSNRDEGGS